jgi:hypothetical protein
MRARKIKVFLKESMPPTEFMVWFYAGLGHLKAYSVLYIIRRQES